MDSRKAGQNDQTPTDAHLTDAQLWRAIAQGDTNALGVLYDRHAGLVYGIASKVLGNAQEAEDLAQDIFLKLTEGTSYDPQRGSLRTFLAVLTRSRALDRLRSHQRREKRSRRAQGDVLSSFTSAENEPGDDISQQEQSREVRAALAALSGNQRQILTMTYYDGLTQAAIAKQLNIPVGTVKSRARRGLLNLRQAIQERSEQP